MNWTNILHQSGFRVTPARIAVLEVIEKAHEPIDAASIHALVSERKIQCNLVTVYRMLESFVSKNVVTQIDFQDGKFRYEIMHDHHHHLVCTQCGCIQSIHEVCIAMSEQQVAKQYGFTITRHQLEFFGLCNKCNKT